jgi:hypothetical protein
MMWSGELVNGFVETATSINWWLLRGIPFLAGGLQNDIEHMGQSVLGTCNLETMVIGVPPAFPCGSGRVYSSSDSSSSQGTFATTMTLSDTNRNASMALEVSRCIVPSCQHVTSLTEQMKTHHYSLRCFPIQNQEFILSPVFLLQKYSQ